MKLIVLAILCGLACAQTSNIFILTPSDAKLLKEAYTKYADAEAHYESLKKQVVATYGKYDSRAVSFNPDFTACSVASFIQGVDSESTFGSDSFWSAAGAAGISSAGQSVK